MLGTRNSPNGRTRRSGDHILESDISQRGRHRRPREEVVLGWRIQGDDGKADRAGKVGRAQVM